MTYLIVNDSLNQTVNIFCKDVEAVNKALSSYSDKKNIKLYEVKQIKLVKQQAVVMGEG